MKEICGRWKWICEVERRRRGHCTGLLEGSNRKDLLRECLIELNLVFDISFPSSSSYITISFWYISIQVCTACWNDSVEFMCLEELKEPRVREIEGSVGYEW